MFWGQQKASYDTFLASIVWLYFSLPCSDIPVFYIFPPSMEEPLQFFILSWRTPIYENEKKATRQFVLQGDYCSIAIWRTKIPSILRGVFVIFRGVL